MNYSTASKIREKGVHETPCYRYEYRNDFILRWKWREWQTEQATGWNFASVAYQFKNA